ncbi:leucine-rich repeat and death domain-containing protein 1 isoform X4 [Rhinatrema bivittatum]|uniref:leucine-rich repeat and death domain-containing protein 1 isoform X4 n=1 Tax=Rhinatrema bivittatum TaxID=194408 RepID=UPI00112B9F42|nr:leucine-rich repeat and death domain-containing protein 1 isoform X4 [Rhinatrema bivittatum]
MCLKITKLPEELCNLTQLKELDISHNAFETLPNDFGEIKSLVRLIAASNHLRQLPKSITSLSCLQELNLNNNQLTSLPGDIYRLEALKEIHLDGNPLLAPPREFCEGKQLYPIGRYLQTVDIRNEKILQKMFQIISFDISKSDFEEFCNKLQLQTTFRVLQKDKTLKLQDKVLSALNIWKMENQAKMSPIAMIEYLTRVLVMADLHSLANKVGTLRTFTEVMNF